MTNFYVDAASPDDSGNGLSWATAKKTIAAAYALVTAGASDVINVAAGTYTPGSLILAKSGMTLQGPNALINPVTNAGSRVSEAILQAASLLVDASNIQILGFKWNGVAPSMGRAVGGTNNATTRTDCTIRNNIMVAGTGVMTWGVFPITSGGFVNWTVEQNVIGPWTGASGTAIWLNGLMGGSNCIFRGNKIDGSTATNSRGINCGDKYDGVLVEDNWINTTTWCVQSPNQSKNVVIRGNTVQGTLTSGSALIQAWADLSGVAENITIENNICLNSQRLGIAVYPGYGYYKGDVIIRNNQISWNPSLLQAPFAAIDVRVYGAVPGSPACNVTISGNVINFVGGYTGLTTSAFGIKIRGDKLTTANIFGNKVDGGGYTSTEAVLPKPSGVFLTTNDAAGGVMSGEVNISNNEFTGLYHGVMAFDQAMVAYGALSANVKISDWVMKTGQLSDSAVKSALPGNAIDARGLWWGDFSGPSGGAADPVTGKIANGYGLKVSENVRFDAWMSSGVYVRPTEPRDRDLAPTLEYTLPRAAAGSDSAQEPMESAQFDGGMPLFQDGKTKVIPSGAPGNAITKTAGDKGETGYNRKNAGVVMPWGDRPSRFDNPGKK